MILDRVVSGDLGPHHLDDFGRGRRAMQPRRDKDRNRARGMPASSSVGRTCERISRFGTGRVMSQITTQALRRPRASSASGNVPVGAASFCASSAAGSTSGGAFLYPNERTTRSAGSSTCKPVLPYSSVTRMILMAWRRRLSLRIDRSQAGLPQGSRAPSRAVA